MYCGQVTATQVPGFLHQIPLSPKYNVQAAKRQASIYQSIQTSPIILWKILQCHIVAARLSDRIP